MSLLFIALGFMAMTIVAKWFASTSLTSQKTKLTEALDMAGQAKFRLKTAVQEVTNTNAEMDKLKRKIKTSQRKISLCWQSAVSVSRDFFLPGGFN